MKSINLQPLKIKIMQKIQLLIFVFAFISCNSNKNENTNNPPQVAALTTAEIPQTEGYEVGDLATDFNLKNVDGKRVTLADYEDAKGFIVVFTCNHCPFSKAYEDRIIDLDKKYQSKGFPVIAINPTNPEKYPTDSFENMQKRAEEKDYTFPYLLDVGQEIFPQYGATNTPHMYVLNKTSQGNKVAYIGAIDDNSKDPSAVQKRLKMRLTHYL